MAVSFAQDIRPLFTGINIAHMKSFGVALDGSGYRRSSPRAEGPGHGQPRGAGSLTIEYAAGGVGVNSFRPGVIRTPVHPAES